MGIKLISSVILIAIIKLSYIVIKLPLKNKNDETQKIKDKLPKQAK